MQQNHIDNRVFTYPFLPFLLILCLFRWERGREGKILSCSWFGWEKGKGGENTLLFIVWLGKGGRINWWGLGFVIRIDRSSSILNTLFSSQQFITFISKVLNCFLSTPLAILGLIDSSNLYFPQDFHFLSDPIP